MPPLLTVPQVAVFTLHHQVGASVQTVDNVQAWRLDFTDSGDRDAAIPAIAGMIGNAWADDVLPLLGNQLELQSVNYVDLNTEEGVAGTTVLTPTEGGEGVDQLPPNVCVLLHKVCNTSRGIRNGRMYVSGIREDYVDDSGTVTGGFQDELAGAVKLAWLAASGAIELAYDMASSSPCVVHAAAQTSSDMYDVVGDTRVATQRRRVRN